MTNLIWMTPSVAHRGRTEERVWSYTGFVVENFPAADHVSTQETTAYRVHIKRLEATDMVAGDWRLS